MFGIKGKKGNLQDLILIMIVLLFFGMIVLFSFKVSDEFNDKIQASDVFDTQGKAAASSLNSNFTGAVDNSFLLLVIGIVIVVLASAVLVKVHPIFIPFFILGLILVIFISGVASNIYQETAANSVIVAQSSQLTFISTVLNVLPLFVGVFGILIMIILHKTDAFGGNQ